MAAIKRCPKCKKGKRSYDSYCLPCGRIYRREWARKNSGKFKAYRRKNASKIKAQKAANYAKNAPKVKAQVAEYRKGHLAQLRNWDRAYRIKCPWMVLFKNARLRSQQRGFDFSISVEDVKQAYDKAQKLGSCPYLGIPFVFNTVGTRRRVAGSPSLDRIDSGKGYTPDNIEVISWRANHVKGDATADELLAVAKKLKSRLEI